MEDILKVGQLFLGKYRIEKLVGKGGMGAVYAAVDSDLARKVAIKILLPHIASSRTAATRFVNEGRAAARIESEHVARVYSAGRTPQGLPFMILELLEGTDVADLLEKHKRLGVAEAVDIMIDALQAVAEAHRLGIVHRDLKPSNLFLHRRGNGSQVVKVLDFGISKLTQPMSTTSDQGLTATQALLGTPNYMSPEQLLDSKSVDHRTDIWSLGVILYEMLAGTVPFGGPTLRELFSAILHQQTAPLPHLRGDVPAGLQMAIDRCMTRDPQRRIGDAAELARLLAPFGSGARAPFGRVPFDEEPTTVAAAPLAMPSAPQLVSGPGGVRTMTATNEQRLAVPAPMPPPEHVWAHTNQANITPSPVQMDSPWAGQYAAAVTRPRTSSRSLLPYAIAVPLVGILAAGAIIVAARVVQTKTEAVTSALSANSPPPEPAASPPPTPSAELPRAEAADAAASSPAPAPAAVSAPVPAASASAAAPVERPYRGGTPRNTKRESTFDPTKDSRY
ncbi:protein kinase [Pendulispora rubella]|uniref:Protein kinase n=1 Tax=Pendulispora rubella TaxID=2741070 RepID=A0ABZ2KUT6_9BACT